MGLFSKKDTCAICGSPKGEPVADGFVCKECFTKCGLFGASLAVHKKLTRVNNVEKAIDKNTTYKATQADREEVFKPNTVVGHFLLIDEEQGLWSFCNMKQKRTSDIFRFDEIKDYEIEEDENTVVSSGIGKAVAGGLLFGGVGAIVGGSTSKRKVKATCSKLILWVDVPSAPVKVALRLITTEVKKKSFMYKEGCVAIKEIAEYFDSKKSVEEPLASTTSAADDLKKYHDLFTSGAISEEEYNVIKEKLIAKL